jgi:hypothetical protein
MNFAKLSALIIGVGIIGIGSVVASGTHSSSASTGCRAVPTEQEQARTYGQNASLYRAAYARESAEGCVAFREALVEMFLSKEKISSSLLIIKGEDDSFGKMFLKEGEKIYPTQMTFKREGNSEKFRIKIKREDGSEEFLVQKISALLSIIKKKDGSFGIKFFIKKEDDEFVKNIRQNGSVERIKELEKQIERPIYEVLSASDPVTTSGKVHKLLQDSEENNLETLNTMVKEVGSGSETRKHVQVVNTRITSC